MVLVQGPAPLAPPTPQPRLALAGARVSGLWANLHGDLSPP